METRSKKNYKKNNFYKLSITMNGMDADADLYTDLPSVYWCKITEDKGHPQLFSKRLVFGLGYQF